jgi:hypothetical protein
MLRVSKQERLLKLLLGILIYLLREMIQRGKPVLEQGINAILSRTEQHLRIGLVRCGIKSQ